jgi:hypothetical protein
LGGWYDLDPDAGWSVREFDEGFVYGDTTTTVHARLASELDAKTGIVLLREFQSEVKMTRGENSLLSHFITKGKYKTWIQTDLPEQEFSLTAYGLPEPVGVKWDQRTPRYVWFLIAAGAFAALALGFRHLSRRRAARQGAPVAT